MVQMWWITSSLPCCWTWTRVKFPHSFVGHFGFIDVVTCHRNWKLNVELIDSSINQVSQKISERKTIISIKKTRHLHYDRNIFVQHPGMHWGLQIKPTQKEVKNLKKQWPAVQNFSFSQAINSPLVHLLKFRTNLKDTDNNHKV